VGVNEFVSADEQPTAPFQLDPGLGDVLAERIARFRAARAADGARRALDALERGARGSDNLVTLIVEAVEAAATLGEICDRLRGVFGVHRPSVTF
jgi:methylmalonyl-CoA mutase N-terminal domain/subunit